MKEEGGKAMPVRIKVMRIEDILRWKGGQTEGIGGRGTEGGSPMGRGRREGRGGKGTESGD